MNVKKIYIIAFFILVLVQLFVPARMICERENILKKGKPFKFEAEPIDPSDPFRGEYISLSFTENDFKIPGHSWKKGQKVYALLETDNDGFARVTKLTNKKPGREKDFVIAEINKIRLFNRRVVLEYPFDRYYMEEFKAGKAEKEFRNALRKGQETYAIVYIKDGEAVLQDVIINGHSLNGFREK